MSDATRECVQCKTPFTPSVRKQGGGVVQVYCSNNCGKLWWSRHNKKRSTASKRKYASVDANREKKNLQQRICSKGKWSRRATEWVLLNSAKHRARVSGATFSITLLDIHVPEKCPLLGIPLFRSRGLPSPNSPSLDRLDASKGYVPGNVWVISYKANTAKNDLTLAELKLLVENLEDKMTETKLHETRKG